MDTDGDGNRPRLSCYWSSEVTENLVSSLTISDHEPITRALSFPVKDSLYVASGIKYPNNGDRPGDGVIHDQYENTDQNLTGNVVRSWRRWPASGYEASKRKAKVISCNT